MSAVSDGEPTRPLLRQPDFLALFGGQLISISGERLTFVALTGLLLEHTHSFRGAAESSLLLWLLQALLFAHLVLWLPIKLAPRIISLFNPALGEFLKYPFHKELNQNLWIGFAIIAVVSLVCGLIQNILIDQALFSSGNFAIIVPLVICFLAFGLVGNSSDALLNKRFRESIQQVDKVIEFAIAHEGQEVPHEQARKMRLFALSQVQEVVTEERGLVLSNYDEMLGQVDVLVDFQGQWVKCPVIYNQVITCSRVFETPWIRLGTVLKVAALYP